MPFRLGNRNRGTRRRATFAAGAMFFVGATSLASQERVARSASLIVEVRDTAGRPVPAVRVGVAATNRVTFTDSTGVARLPDLPAAV